MSQIFINERVNDLELVSSGHLAMKIRQSL